MLAVFIRKDFLKAIITKFVELLVCLGKPLLQEIDLKGCEQFG